MEVGLQGHHRTVHCYCPFLRADDTDQMRLANVHNFTKTVDELLFQVELQGLKLYPVVHRKGDKAEGF